MKSIFLAAVAVLTVAALASPGAAVTTFNGVTLMDNFDQDTSASPTDHLVGYYDGWNGPWTGWKTVNSGTATKTETNLDPLNGGGTYLSATILNKTEDLKDYRAGFVRDYLNTGFLDPAEDFTIGYTIRIDGTNFNSSSDMVTFRIGKENYYVAQTEDCFNIYMRGNGTLRYLSGDPVAGTNSTFTATGFAVNVGDVYDFDITVHVADKTYDLAVTNANTAATYQATGMGWRYTATALQPYVGFYAHEVTDLETYGFSLDSVQVSQNRAITIGGMTEVAARFNDGQTNATPDGYTGTAGNGWDGAWTKRSDRLTQNVVVKDEFDGVELHSGTGKYLEMTTENMAPGTTGYAVGGVSRDYARINETGIDWTKDHTVQFSVRIDEDIRPELEPELSTFTDVNDKYQIFDQGYARGGFNHETTWGVSVDGESLDSPLWTFINGSDSTVSTIEVTFGTVYDFTIDIDIDGRSYDVTLTDGLNTFTADGLLWRNQVDDFIGGVLNFVARGNAEDDVRAWSIDEIVISQAYSPPEIPGDATGNGSVDEDDAKRLAENWGATSVVFPYESMREMGDFNGDGKIDAKDAAILAANWGYVSSPAAPESSAVAAVPEPGTGALLLTLLIGAAMGFGRRRFVA